MADSGSQLDSILTAIQAFIDGRLQEIAEEELALRDRVLRPISKLKTGLLSRNSCHTAVQSSIQITLEGLQDECSTQNIDSLLTFVRKLPLVLKTWPKDWLPYATLSILKWSDRSDDSQLALMAEGVSDLALTYSEETLLTCCRIATLCRMLAESNSISRWLAKGASFEHLGSGILKNVSNPDVRAAINEYERRRPGSALFTDEGIFFDSSHPSISQFKSQHLISLGMTAPPFDQFVLEPNHAEFPISYFPLPRNRVALAALLRPYDDALQDLFGVGTESILEVLQAIGSLIIRSFLTSTEENSWSFSGSLQNEGFNRRFLFMLGICRRGYLRFPEDHLRDEIARQLSKEYSGEALRAEETVNRFFGAFCRRAEHTKDIDVGRLEPLSILYVTAGNQCYLDLPWFDDFFRWLIIRSREWFSSQHGDRFTLAVKRLVEERSPHSKVVGWKKTYIGSSNEQVEADLLIENDGILSVVECKAHAKSRGFWLGELPATRRRIQKISEAVAQARRTTNTLAELLEGGHIPLRGIRTIEWVVCTPSQEFLLPVDKFGYLSPGIPRVCTPEELINHFCRSK